MPIQAKCGFKTPCKALEDRLNGINQKYSKGISVLVLTNLVTRNSALAGIVYRTSNKDEGGTLFNFCPFCGESLESWLEPHLEKKKTKKVKK